MRCKLVKIFLPIVMLFGSLQALSLSKEVEISNLYFSLSQDINSSDNEQIYRHILKSISEDGSLVTFTDNMSASINWWYRSIAKKWKNGDQIYIFYDSENKEVTLEHVDSKTIAYGELKSSPSRLWIIKAISDDDKGYSKIILDNGSNFRCVYSGSLRNWEEKDRVFVLVNPNGRYQVWNIDAKEFVTCELLKACDQTVKQPIEIKDILGLEGRLNAKVLQQPEATKAILSSLLNYTVGLQEKEKPIGVFLFIGPTGVGKTELAKSLAQEIYDDPKKILRFDMSHFSEPHSISRLIGSQPGYVNHEEGGQLTNPLMDNSQIIVLLDEIEKAHPRVIKAFLPVFDEGFILDTKNNRIACSETIFIMTSNLCSDEIIELYSQGYSSDEILMLIEPELMKALSPELYNRVEPVLFRPIAEETMGMLVDLMLDKVAKRVMTEKQIQIHIDPSLKDYLMEKGYHPLLGARPLKKLIEKQVVTALAYTIITEGIANGSELLLLYELKTESIKVQKIEKVQSVQENSELVK